jgi:hypothetical protein
MMDEIEARKIRDEVIAIGGRSYNDLVAKSNWEGKLLIEVIMEWGDPREWHGLNPKRKES